MNILQYKWSLQNIRLLLNEYFTIQMVSYKDEEIIQNGMLDKIKSGIFNFDCILLIIINSYNIKSLTLGSLKYALTSSLELKVYDLETLSLIYFILYFLR
jgi:hypothetical protein